MSGAFPWKLDSIVWELTLRCCFRCAYCGSRAGEARENELTTAECLDVASQLAELGCRRVNLLGGEVFLRPDWREITAALTGRGMKVCIITSGFVLTGEIMAELEKLKIESVAVSLDGPERVHDAGRREGSYRRALAAIRALTDKGIPTSVISALRADNAPLLPEFYETLKAYPIFAWQLQACSPMGNAGAGSLDTRFDPLEVLRFAASEAPKAPFTILVADNIGYFTPEETSIRGGQGLCFGGCSAGLTTLGIDSVGNVRGCESLYDERFIEGNLRQRSLREIWEDENAFRYNRDFEPRLLTGKCARCELGEYCGGGCRSYNYFAGGKLYESPLCPRQPEGGCGPMTDPGRIPVVVGVSGHRALRPQDRETLLEAVKRELTNLQAQVPHSPLLLLTSLAEGADLLCADAARELGVSVAVALPMEAEAYTAAFSPEDKRRFEAHCRSAQTVFVVPPSEEAPETPDSSWLYRQAGIYISLHSHLLLALWDGGPAKEQGCGTAEAVSFSLGGAYRPRRGMPLRSAENTAVLHIWAPRASGGGRAGETRLLGNEEAFLETLRKTDELNRLAPETEPQGGLLPEGPEGDSLLAGLEAVYHVSDALSLRCAKKYRRILGLLAAASTAVTAGFLLYDEAGLSWMLLLCGAMLLFALFCRRWAVRSDCHRGYIEYRVLAESLRTQAFLRYAGSEQEAPELFPRTQREECPWVLAALCALTVGPPPAQQRDIRVCWAEGQRDYHEQAEKRTHRAMLRSDLVVRAALCASVALYVLALLFEAFFGGLFLPPAAAPSLIELWRTLLKVALGLLSAATIFIANYYGKQSLSRVISDHGKMKRFYAEVAGQLERFGQSEELLRTLAAEELVENGNWCSYQRDNTPDISL